jgi:hypothetical protein
MPYYAAGVWLQDLVHDQYRGRGGLAERDAVVWAHPVQHITVKVHGHGMMATARQHISQELLLPQIDGEGIADPKRTPCSVIYCDGLVDNAAQDQMGLRTSSSLSSPIDGIT